MGITNEEYINLHIKCADTLRWFSDQMLAKISQRLYHGDWSERDILEVYRWILAEMNELNEAVETALINKELQAVIDECRDVAATSMMLADICYKKLNRKEDICG